MGRDGLDLLPRQLRTYDYSPGSAVGHHLPAPNRYAHADPAAGRRLYRCADLGLRPADRRLYQHHQR